MQTFKRNEFNILKLIDSARRNADPRKAKIEKGLVELVRQKCPVSSTRAGIPLPTTELLRDLQLTVGLDGQNLAGAVSNPMAQVAGAARPGLVLEAAGIQHHLELGWIIRNENLIKQMRIDDSALIEELDPVERQPFSPDRLRVTISPKVSTLRALKIHQLIERFEKGEIIPTSDPLFQAIHSKAQTHSGKVTTALGITPAKTASGTISRLLGICGWQLNSRSRCRQRGSDRDATLYSAAPIAMPDGISYDDLIQRFDTDFESGANASLSTKCVGNDLPQSRRHRPSLPPSGPTRSAPDIRNRVRSMLNRVKSAAGFG